MPNSTCRLLSNGYKFDIDQSSNIFYKPCCHFPDSVSLNLSAAPNKHQEFRQQLNAINSYESDTCIDCNFQENSKLKKTFRNLSFDVVPDDAELGDASYLEIQTDKVCNGGCIICGPWNSSFWQSELKQFSINPAQDPIDQILSHIDIQKTRRITFLGGEPFLSDTDTKILPLIKQPELVSLQYTTNGSIYPSQFHIDLWSKFKSVAILVSLDGIGDRFDYIRYPLKWSQVEKNVFRMYEQMPANVIFKCNHTINILNLFYYDEFDNWYKILQHNPRILDFNFSPANGILSPFKVPEKLYHMLINKYGRDSKVIRTVSNGDCDDHREMLAYLDELDTRRGLDWRQVFPEISDCFNKETICS